MASNDSQQEENSSFLGKGWDFPVTFRRGHDGVEMISDVEDINSSLEILLSTELGERVLRPDYGTKVHDLIFEILDVSTGTLISEEIRRAILFHEPRINVENIEYTQDALNGKIEVFIEYTVITTNTRSNLVFPFYFNEGTDIQE